MATLKDLQKAIRAKTGFETLPYLDDLEWVRITDEGAPEKLRIGTCEATPVFATFNINRPDRSQLRILNEKNKQEVIELDKKQMRTVEYLKPFSYWMDRPYEGAEIAQRFKTYLKACFILRGHAAGNSVSLDTYNFPRVVQVIESKRRRGEEQADTSRPAAGRVYTLRGMIGKEEVGSPMISGFGSELTLRQERTQSAQPSNPPSGQDIVHARATDRTGTNPFGITSPTYNSRTARDTSSNREAVMNANIIGLLNGTISDPIDYPLSKAGSMQRDRALGIFPGPPLGQPTRAHTKQNPARTARSATAIGRPEQVHDDVVNRGINALRGFTRAQHPRTPPLRTPPSRTATAADALETPRAGSDQQGDRVPPAISGPPFVTGATPFAANISHASDKMTDEDRVWMMTPDSELPNPESVEEYVTVYKTIGAAHARIVAHRRLVAQNEGQISALQEEIKEASESTNRKETDILQKLSESNRTILSLPSLPNHTDLAAQIEAYGQATDRIKAAQAEIAEFKTAYTNRTTELQRQLGDLEMRAQVEREGITRAEKEMEAGRKRKREIEGVGGTDLAFLAGREVERAAKKRRTE